MVGSAAAVTPGRTNYVSGRATRELLVLTAERLFAERGVGGVSLREIGAQAGQRNTAAVKYHFSDRDGLVRAIFELRLPGVNDCRRDLLGQLRAEGRLADVRGLLEAFALPLVAEAGEGHYVAFLSRLLHHTRATHPIWATEPWLTETAEEVIRRLSAQVPDPDASARSRRVGLVVSFIIGALAAHQMAVEKDLPGAGVGGTLLDEVLGLAVGMISATLPKSSMPT